MIAVKVVVGAAILVLFSPATLTSDGPGASFIGAIVSLKRVCINSFVVLGWFREDVLAAAAFLFLLLYTYAASPVWRTYIQRSVFYIYIYICELWQWRAPSSMSHPRSSYLYDALIWGCSVVLPRIVISVVVFLLLLLQATFISRVTAKCSICIIQPTDREKMRKKDKVGADNLCVASAPAGLHGDRQKFTIHS